MQRSAHPQLINKPSFPVQRTCCRGDVTHLDDHKLPYIQDVEQACPDLLSAVKEVKPTVLIGLTSEAKPPHAFTREVGGGFVGGFGCVLGGWWLGGLGRKCGCQTALRLTLGGGLGFATGGFVVGGDCRA